MELGALRKFAHRGVRRAAAEVERCELCAEPLEGGHRHVVDLDRRSLCCACRPCAILFERQGAGAGRYRTVPERVCVDPDGLDEGRWEALSIPVRLAFVFFNSSMDRWVAFYPSPAGATESELGLEAMSALILSSRLVRSIEPDVEALLVRGRRPGGAQEAYLVPIDRCYDLVALVREGWRGFDGGDEVRAKLDAFFERLRLQSRALPPEREMAR